MSAPPGEISYRWEPPDTSFVAFIGHVSGDHMRELIAAGWRHRSGGLPYALVLIDVSRLDHLSAEAREIGKAHSRQGPNGAAPLRGTAIFGGSFHFRVIARFATMAFNLLKRQDDNIFRFFDTEEAARAWLAERRRELKAQGIEPPPHG